MTSFSRYILQRLFLAAVTLIAISLIVFLLLRLTPGDPGRILAGMLATEEEVQNVRVEMGLDRPLGVQFAMFFGRLMRGDLGISARSREPVLQEILARLPATMQLAVLSMTLAGLVGIAGGVLAAYRRNTKLDFLVTIGTLLGSSLPGYWLGIMLIVLFAVQLRWLPAAGSQSPASYVMPSLTLAAYSVALIARMTRSSMLEVLGEDYIRTARAKGVRELAVVLRHALRNALMPIITVLGLQFGALLGGAVLTETVFGWPGIGRHLVSSIFARDYPMVQGIVLVFSFMFILVNLAVDILYAYINPRIRYE